MGPSLNHEAFAWRHWQINGAGGTTRDLAETILVQTQHVAPRGASTSDDLLTFGAVHLDVTDLDRSLLFWHDLVGLRELGRDGLAVALGTAEGPLVVLHPGATERLVRRHSGLYHLAIHLPSIGELARITARLAQAKYPQAPTDHVSHYANYADDPDGNGLELAFETWGRIREIAWDGGWPQVTDVDGNVTDGRAPIDRSWLESMIPDDDLEREMPEDSFIGHLQLRVPDLDETLTFYRDMIGLTANRFTPAMRMIDMSAGGSFGHRFAANTWESHGCPPRPAGMAGLRTLALNYRAQGAFVGAVERLRAAGRAVTLDPDGDHATVFDPSGNALELTWA